MNKSSHSTQLRSKGRTSNNMQLAELLVWCSLNGFVAILAVLGNSFVIAAFMRFKKLRTRTNYFVVGLAAADILVGLLSIPFWITTMVPIWLESVSWKRRSLFYRAFIALDVFSGIASILHLLLISLERLYAIGCPVRHRVSSTRSYILAASLSWCLTLIVAYVSKLLHYSNSAVNPLVYGYRLPEFKRAFRILIKSRKNFVLPP
ncbi:octopamine receptor beta-1R-like [Porites lutea]|uniref:octopamine receptor beta-1R-like n=1 Tax=Porites lutea TaxID=51062 RepID=UPI003CC603EA